MKRSSAPLTAALLAAAATAVVSVGCGPTASGGDANLINGKRLYVSKCGACHVLYRAGSKGVTGPNLDAAFAEALRSGFQRSTYAGVIHRQILYPDTKGAMPANLVTGQDARDVSAYVAFAASKPGMDEGALANAVPGQNQKVAVEKGGQLQIDPDPNGQLLYDASGATGTAGTLTMVSVNKAAVPHNIALEGPGIKTTLGNIVQGGGTSKITVSVKAGKYTFFCSVPGHRQAGDLDPHVGRGQPGRHLRL
jgi:mono/diheme cytochrome c family protein